MSDYRLNISIALIPLAFMFVPGLYDKEWSAELSIETVERKEEIPA